MPKASPSILRRLVSAVCPPSSAIRRLSSALWLLPLAWLWFVLIGNLCVEWTYNPQYGYGWAVPFLCLFLLVRNLKRSQVSGFSSQVSSLIPCFSGPVKSEATAPASPPSSAIRHPSSVICRLTSDLRPLTSVFLAFLAFFYLPTRLVQIANPDWRLVSWALALETIGITYCLLSGLRSQVSSLAFPVSGLKFQVSSLRFPLLFFLVSVPWPTLIEYPLIQTLTRMDVSATCDLVGWFGIPAVPHGNVIEVATGMVGIDEACSGIRSFQASLMISLFLGEYYSLVRLRRVLCVLAGFALALLLNLARLSVLAWVAASQGVPAIAKWHDPTGVIILLSCFFALWGIGLWLAPKKQKPEVTSPPSSSLPSDLSQLPTAHCQLTTAPSLRSQVFSLLTSDLRPLTSDLWSAFALAAWLLLVETGVEGWYRIHEARLPVATEWRVAWPTSNATFKELELAQITRQLLRYSDARYASWQDDGLGWQVIFLHWKPGAIAQRMAGEHTPQTCLGASGHKFIGGQDIQYLTVGDMKMPFRFYQLTDTPLPVFEAYCLWDDRTSIRTFEATSLTYAWRISPVLAGQRNPGQRAIEIAVTGADSPGAAQVAVQKLLGKIIVPPR